MKKIIALLIALTSTAHAYITPQYLNANQLQGVNISATAPTLNQVLLYDGTNWAPTTIATGGGTVTSVAMSVPSFLSVAGSPITSSGTLAVSLSGTALPVANGGTGTTTAFTQGSVPFAGASGVYSQDNANYFWDATNHRLGLGNAAPSTTLDVTGSQNITSTSANALTIGLNGATNPVLQIDTSTASQAAGLKVTGGASGGGVTVSVISSGTNENMTLNTKGTGQFLSQIGGSTRYQSTGTQHLFTVANTTAVTARFGFTGAADTSLSATAEAPAVVYALNQIRQHATGAIALQRDYRIAPSTHSFVGASTLTNAAGLAVDGAPIAGTNATITNSSTIYSAGSAVGAGVTNSYGLNINANTGATNNYSAIFNGGNVGIGTSSPAYPLEVQGLAKITGASPILMDPATGIIYTGAGLVNSTTVSNGKITTPATGPFIERNIADANPALLISNASATSTGDITQFKSNGTVKAVVTYAGNVGIGTTTPGSTLHVAGSMQLKVNNVSSATTLDGTYSTVRGDATSAAFTITLPACVTANIGRIYRIMKIDSSINAVTVGRTGSDTINGATTSSLATQYSAKTYVCGAAGLWEIY